MTVIIVIIVIIVIVVVIVIIAIIVIVIVRMLAPSDMLPALRPAEAGCGTRTFCRFIEILRQGP